MNNLVGKSVVYNGGKYAFCGCSDYHKLVVGERYVVTSANDRNWQVDLSLKGIEGEFNSLWFDEVKDVHTTKKTWLAKATLYNNPCSFVGKRVSLQRFDDNTKSFESVSISKVVKVERMYANVYLFETANSVYVTDVALRTGC